MSEATASTPQSLYDFLGAEPEATNQIREIVEAFYDVMESHEREFVGEKIIKIIFR
jgi:hypothetical protein